MTTKLKIDLSQGLLEVEGSESFVRTIYSDFKTHFAGIVEAAEEGKKPRRSRKSAVAPTSKRTAAKKATKQQTPPTVKEATPESKPQIATPTYSYVEGLDLGAKNDRPALVEFMDAKFPITNEERNIVFLYYLEQMLKLKSVTPSHIYTCYRAAKIRAPLNIENSLTRRDWIELTEDGQLTLTKNGKDYVEKQLPKRRKN